MSFLHKTRDQISDIFSDFRRYIAPAYYHDRCERSLHMNVYAMHRREILLSLAGFLSTFILMLFIGLAGPNVVKLDLLKASEIFEKDQITNISVQQSLLVSGPFIVNVPEMSSFSNRICLWITFFIKGDPDTGAFQKQFTITINIRGKINGNNSGEAILIDSDAGRHHHLNCNGNLCEPIQVMHLEYLKYSNYEIEMKFKDLEHFNSKNPITDIDFTFQSINPSFTSLTIWFRFIFLVLTFIITCWFTHSLLRYNFIDWSMEQKWTTYLLICLILYDNPLYPLMYLYDSNFPHILEILFQSTFFCSLLLFYISFFHGIRQNNRSLTRFYGPKLVIITLIWFTIMYGACWSQTIKMEHPTLDEKEAYQTSLFLQALNLIFFLLSLIYWMYLSLLLLTTFTELRSMPYFDLRLKIQAFFLCFMVTFSIILIILSKSSLSSIDNNNIIGQNDITSIPYLQLLPITYQSSSSSAFLSLFSAVNFCIYSFAFFYYPSASSLMDSRIIRDNPTLSMLNDSDEDVIYGSDVEQHQPKLIEMYNDDDDSD